MARRIKSFFAAFALIFTSCQTEINYPKLSTDYLQPIFSEIRKIDSNARTLEFIPEDEEFEYLDKLIKGNFFEAGPYNIDGHPIEVIEHEMTVTSDSSFTRYILAGQRMIEKLRRDSGGTVIHRIEYNKNMVDQIIEIRQKEKDTSKIRFRYDKNNRLVRKRLLTASGITFTRFDFIYRSKGNLDYVYTIANSESRGFDKFEFNNNRKQCIVSKFDKNKILKWLMYREYDDSGNIKYEERYIKEYGSPVFRKETYRYNQGNEIISLEANRPITKHESRYDFVYPKRDSQNNWIEQITFENDEYFLTTKRTIKYGLNN